MAKLPADEQAGVARVRAIMDGRTSVFDYRIILKKELEKRKKLSPKYSLRDFAKFLCLCPSHLCEILQKKKGISTVVAHRIATVLHFTGPERRQFVFLVKARSARARVRRYAAMAFLLRSTSAEGQEKILKICNENQRWAAQMKRYFNGSREFDQRVMDARLESVRIDIGELTKPFIGYQPW